MYPYGLIGNCQAAALVKETGSIDWFCAPYPDSPPLLGRLLDPDGGHFSVSLAVPPNGEVTSVQYYLPNTNILVTTIHGDEGAISITDFFPRFEQYGRMYRPISLFRIVEPISGTPRIQVSCRPVDGWSKKPVPPVRGNSHLRFDIGDNPLRLTTTMPLTHLAEGSAYGLKEPAYFALTWGLGIEQDLKETARDFLAKTTNYWRTWVKHCSVPAAYQVETIRSALALKLHCYEDTGAILAGVTTSLPEELGATRNWDYRHCWLRDSYFTLSALHKLGHFEEMENFLKFLLGIVHTRDRLHPVYRIDGTLPLPEYEHAEWAGFGNSRPVRSYNAAATHVQNDAYGEMLLTLAPIFFDERFYHLRVPEHEKLVEHLATHCAKSIGVPDAGLWEFRDGGMENSFTNMMCWAGLDRTQKLRQLGFLPGITWDVAGELERAEQRVMAAVVEGSIRNGPGDPSFNAALLQAPMLRFGDRKLAEGTIDAIWKGLRSAVDGDGSAFLFRYRRADDFGVPQSAFVICSFWWIEALAKVGRIQQARQEMDAVLKATNRLGLFSEHFEFKHHKQLGNFPQAYSHVGSINAAFAISPSWDEIL